MSVTPALVKELREKTGAGMMDCKKALAEVNGSLEHAVDWLRKKGLAAAAKKSGRVAAEGLVGVAVSGAKGAILEVNAETDFVGRNEHFQEFVKAATKLTMDAKGDLETLKTLTYPGTSENISERLTQLIATIGENMALRRSGFLEVKDGVVVSYLHNAISPELGRIGVLVALESTASKDELTQLGKQIAMHIAAARPTALKTTDLSSADVERERAIFKDQAIASGKPAEFADKMVEGRIRKYYEEVVLEEQAFIMDPKSRVKDVVEQKGKELGSSVVLSGFLSFALGEGIEKEESDFAAEVASLAK
ncbi:Elongation factor Ts [Candidatus Bealeia paramacronuclearis]|uniref:Elongation factor Ts n=1 Tax=Candidatus Bealeia paramacronuclearis TaxID=1921001 RepID=A0ABZ2C4W6_9PROT|nr:Elongation factor Ts [Candidatus Bealeia paramacronuclearis]